MKLSKDSRVAVGAFGVLVLVVGLGLWSYEREYGSGLNFAGESDGEVVRVYEVNEQFPDAEGNPGTKLVFEGTEEEASEYMAQRRAERTNYLVPGLVIVFGALVVIAALIQPRKVHPTSH